MRWPAAENAEQAREHGVFRTAKILRLYCNKLKALATTAHADRKMTAPAGFMELLTTPPSGAPECVVELEGPRGKMRILVAIGPVDLRKGIDGLAQLCREKLGADPFSGYLFLFRGRRATAIKLLAYDGQGFSGTSGRRQSKVRFARKALAPVNVAI